MRSKKAKVSFDVDELLKDEAFLKKLLKIKRRSTKL
jgi:hypothetical protein